MNEAMAKMFDDDPENNYDVIPAIKELLNKKSIIDDLEVRLREIKQAFSDDEQNITALMDANNMQSVNVDGFTVYKRVDTYARINKDFEDEAKDWIRKEGYENLIKETVNARSLTSAMKELIEDAGPEAVPADLILISTVNKIGIRKAPKRIK